VFHSKGGDLHCCTRIGDFVVDLAEVEAKGLFNGEHFSKLGKTVFNKSTLNDFIELGKDYWHEARVTLQALYASGSEKES
jgi:fumarylacetoacetase